jgi:hypothetical protein
MLEAQNGRCAVCQRKSRLTLAVEHSHITGTVRGLCCMGCNRDLIGPVDGDLDKIDRLIKFFQFMRDDLAAHVASTAAGYGTGYDPLPERLVEPNATAPRPLSLPRVTRVAT